jgi:D-alanyl-lipoteichoic acid biosynthesis protein DltD
MLLKKIALYQILPILIASALTYVLVLKFIKVNTLNYSVSAKTIQQTHGIDVFHIDNLNNQIAFSIALKKSVPVLFGSSELTSSHLDGLAGNFFNKNQKTDCFFSIGHAGFQNFAILTTLSANKSLLKDSKITIILSPGWFEKQYCKGTSLKSFFEFCPPNYLYQIYKDTSLDLKTKQHIQNYLYTNYDKISKPDAVMRLMSKNHNPKFLNNIFNYPFATLDNYEIKIQEASDFYLTSQQLILNELTKHSCNPYHFYNQNINWDSLKTKAQQEFKKISNNNTIAVENSYYDAWLKNKPKKKLYAVEAKNNTEYNDFLALLHFLKANNCKPLFVIMPLNTKAHQNLEVLEPTINAIKQELTSNNLKVLDLFSPNLINYEDGVLEDIMHPYNIGWYQIDKFILDNYHD